MLKRLAAPSVLLVSAIACGSGSKSTSGGSDGGVAPQPDSACGSVRLTYYDASARGWCEFDRTLSILPAFVRSGLTTAIAEPYDGSSYGGEVGEACGECWEVATLGGTRTVMVHDLCPIEGNPLCAGGHFHFDLSHESATALQMDGLDEGQARRVACPVSGNIFLEVLDRNQYGYLRFAVVNHRIPVKTVEYRSAADATWQAARRSGGAWEVMNDAMSDMFAAGKPGGVFRFTSAQGQTVEGGSVLGYSTGIGSAFDTGAQFTDASAPAGPACVFEPPAVVYGDGFGGIPEVRWTMNPWPGASWKEVTDGCFGDQGSCLHVELPQWGGFHIYYRQDFPRDTFARLSLRVKLSSGKGNVSVAPSREGTTCQQTTFAPGPAWSQVTVDLASACSSLATIDAVTVQADSQVALLVDDIRFDH